MAFLSRIVIQAGLILSARRNRLGGILLQAPSRRQQKQETDRVQSDAEEERFTRATLYDAPVADTVDRDAEVQTSDPAL
jgi:hypothetical protein